MATLGVMNDEDLSTAMHYFRSPQSEWFLGLRLTTHYEIMQNACSEWW